MPSFVIQGSNYLHGTIPVYGSKNAATPILAATILTKEICVIDNVPRINDVQCMLDILAGMGAQVAWEGKRRVRVCAKNINPKKIDDRLVKKMRSSILLLGALAARFDRFRLYHPGGCVIGKRPVGTHFDALEKLGIVVKERGKAYSVDAHRRKPRTVVLKEFSVTATENVMMAAAGMEGTTTIKIAAAEPHVEDLGTFLVALGAKIRGLGTHTITITGTKKLHGAQHTIIPDANEAATFLILGAATKSPITVAHAREEHLDIVLEKLREFGVDFIVRKNAITVRPAKVLRAVPKIDARTYPGIPSDIQAPLGVLATQAKGDTLFFDTLFEGRFNYVSELEKMGARAMILNPHQVIFSGPTRLRGTTIKSFDLRAGAALIIAALAGKGTTTIEDIQQVDRGYEKIEERLQTIGAKIRRVA